MKSRELLFGNLVILVRVHGIDDVLRIARHGNRSCLQPLASALGHIGRNAAAPTSAHHRGRGHEPLSPTVDANGNLHGNLYVGYSSEYRTMQKFYGYGSCRTRPRTNRGPGFRVRRSVGLHALTWRRHASAWTEPAISSPCSRANPATRRALLGNRLSLAVEKLQQVLGRFAGELIDKKVPTGQRQRRCALRDSGGAIAPECRIVWP
jgi:hypothetical protein